jgi:hypothetical protein
LQFLDVCVMFKFQIFKFGLQIQNFVVWRSLFLDVSLEFFDPVFHTLDMQFELVLHPDVLADISL